MLVLFVEVMSVLVAVDVVVVLVVVVVVVVVASFVAVEDSIWCVIIIVVVVVCVVLNCKLFPVEDSNMFVMKAVVWVFTVVCILLDVGSFVTTELFKSSSSFVAFARKTELWLKHKSLILFTQPDTNDFPYKVALKKKLLKLINSPFIINQVFFSINENISTIKSEHTQKI